MTLLHGIAGAWNAFFHAPESPAKIAVFRMLAGALCLANAALLWPERHYWYGPEGVVPFGRFRHVHGRGRFSLFHHLAPTNGSVDLVLGIHAAASTLLLVGLATPLSAFVAFATLTSLHARNHAINHGGDALLRIVLLLLTFSQAGAVLSLDHRIALALGRGDAGTAWPSPWCTRLIQLQIAIVYFRSAQWKAMGREWRAGSAVYWASARWTYKRFGLPRVLQGPFPVRVLTWSTLFVEYCLPIFVWFAPARYPLLVSVALMHLGIEYAMNLQLFSWIMLACLSLFVPASDVDAALRGLGFL